MTSERRMHYDATLSDVFFRDPALPAAGKLVTGIGCLLGGEIALLPFGNLEERV